MFRYCGMLLGAVCLVVPLAAAAGTQEQGLAILRDLASRPQPHSLQYDFDYQRKTFAVDRSVAEKSDVIERLDSAIAALGTTEEEGRRRKALVNERAFQIERMTHDFGLVQRQRVQTDGARVRYQVLDDLGSPNDAPGQAQSEQARLLRTGVYFFDGNSTMVDVNTSQKEARIIGSAFAYPDLNGLLRPVYAKEIEELAKTNGMRVETAQGPDGLIVTASFPNGSRWEVTVDVVHGSRILAERTYFQDKLTLEKVFGGYKETGGYQLPTEVRVWRPTEEYSMAIGEIAVNPSFSDETFDYLSVLPDKSTVYDLRYDPPLEYTLGGGLEALTVLKDRPLDARGRQLDMALGSAMKAPLPVCPSSGAAAGRHGASGGAAARSPIKKEPVPMWVGAMVALAGMAVVGCGFRVGRRARRVATRPSTQGSIAPETSTEAGTD